MGPAWDFAAAPYCSVPGISSMIGYRAVEVPTSVHAGLPSAQLTVVISLDEGVRASFEAANLRNTAAKRVLAAGLHTRPSHVEQRTGNAGVQLAVHPLAARSLFGVPAAAIAEIDVDGTDLWGGRAIELVDTLTATNSGWHRAFGQVTGVLRAQHARTDAPQVRPEVWQAWDLLSRSAGRIPITTVARATGVSSRHLVTLFRAEVGLTPKSVARLMSFEAVIGALGRAVRAGGPIDLARIAVHSGYADQAHLTREFTGFAGTAPTRWLRDEFRNLQDGGHPRPPDSTA